MEDFTTISNAPREKPRSVYFHIPFCRHRCGYCNFTVVAGRDHLGERFLDALAAEVSGLADRYEIETLFLGGGTPSHLSVQQLDRLGQIIHSRFDFRTGTDASPDAQMGSELTAECNPEDLTEEKAQALASLGVNRISLGVQSLNPKKLNILERAHSPAVVRSAVELARTFARSVSMDLIFAAPNETFDDWKRDIEQAIAIGPDHVSTYELTFEKGTQFWNRLNRNELAESGQDLRADMYEYAMDYLQQQGLSQYEVSSFSKPGHRCQHNLTYWSGDPYFAFGPGASRFIAGRRETNHRSVMQYLKQVESGNSPVAESEQLDVNEAAIERLIIGLRRIEGVDRENFQNRTGRTLQQVAGSTIHELIQNGLMIETGNRIQLTRQGILVSDWIATRFLQSD